MGQSTSQQLHPNINQHFLEMKVNPSQNKLIATSCIRNSITFSNWASRLLKLSNIKNHPLLLPQQFKVISKSPCGQQSILEITYECFYINFADEIARRMEEEKHFEEEELWYLLLTFVEAASISHNLASSLGDVKTSNLLLNKQGQIRVLSNFSLPQFQEAYQQQNAVSALFSPEELESRRNSYKLNRNNYILSESFSIGMAMLEAGTLIKASQLYNYSKNELKMVEFINSTRYWEEFAFYSDVSKQTTHYSPQLKQIILNLLRIQPDRRMTSLEINKILQNYKNDILKLRKFTISDLPNPNHNSNYKPQQPLHSTKTHRLQSHKKNTVNNSLNSSLMIPSFNNSQDVSFQVHLPSSQFYQASDKKESRGSSSHRKRLSVTAFMQEKQRH